MQSNSILKKTNLKTKTVNALTLSPFVPVDEENVCLCSKFRLYSNCICSFDHTTDERMLSYRRELPQESGSESSYYL